MPQLSPGKRVRICLAAADTKAKLLAVHSIRSLHDCNSLPNRPPPINSGLVFLSTRAKRVGGSGANDTQADAFQERKKTDQYICVVVVIIIVIVIAAKVIHFAPPNPRGSIARRSEAPPGQAKPITIEQGRWQATNNAPPPPLRMLAYSGMS